MRKSGGKRSSGGLRSSGKKSSNHGTSTQAPALPANPTKPLPGKPTKPLPAKPTKPLPGDKAETAEGRPLPSIPASISVCISLYI